ncbi:MAG: hypothetical protein JWO09_2735 [Bacteroidetes bacterium]|nr:hypothetical protein [Bacteroidota bacterium]
MPGRTCYNDTSVADGTDDYEEFSFAYFLFCLFSLEMLELTIDMRDRKDVLKDIIAYNGNLDNLKKELSNYEWDVKEPILIVSRSDVSNTINKYIDNLISFKDLENWANIIEFRDDVDFESEQVKNAVIDMANPEINGALNDAKLKEIISALKE